MKIHILYQFRNGPYGGVNQFLKALKNIFKQQGCYEENIAQADIVLYNSSNATEEVLSAKKNNRKQLFVQRTDGPCSFYTEKKDNRDLIAFNMNRFVADATVFQTNYSREANFDLGLNRNKFETTIPNAPDERIFYPKESNVLPKDRKIRLVASSWSANPHKGFETYRYMDETLDFNRYEMFFVGNSPVKFQNIKVLDAMSTEELAPMLRDCDIYITASQKDPCSNSLIEAMFCGLPVLALRDGGHPELVGEAGELFDNYGEISGLLDKICKNYESYRSKMNLESIEYIGKKYYDFLNEVYVSWQQGGYREKHLTIQGRAVMYSLLMKIRVKDKLRRILSR